MGNMVYLYFMINTETNTIMTTLTMTHSFTHYKGYAIQKPFNIKTHCAVIYKCGEIVKCIAGDIFADGSENSIEKSKKFIDSIS